MKRAGVNWKQVRERLLSSEMALEEALAESAERIEVAYRQRALRLATGQAEPRPASARLPVLVFRLGQERYAVELKEVSEVLPFAHCTPVPGAAPHFLGVIGLRGELRAVVDLSRLLGSSASGNGDSGLVLMLRRPDSELGLKVDSIEDLREISIEELSPSPQGNHVKGVASGTLMLVDIGTLVTDILFKEGVLI